MNTPTKCTAVDANARVESIADANARMSRDYPAIMTEQDQSLHVFADGCFWSVWLNPGDCDFTGLCLASDASTRDAALAEAVACLEAAVEALQSPTAADLPALTPSAAPCAMTLDPSYAPADELAAVGIAAASSLIAYLTEVRDHLVDGRQLSALGVSASIARPVEELNAALCLLARRNRT